MDQVFCIGEVFEVLFQIQSTLHFSFKFSSYELQVEAEYQRKGLGAFMMKALEDMALYWKMEKVVLTVLKNNPDACKFYKRLG